MKAIWNGTVIAQSDDTVVVEGNHYFPAGAVDPDVLRQRVDAVVLGVGLSLLEAAAVPGETLAADALANAIAPVFSAAYRPGRIAVAMSGGVDSAVALLRAGPNAIGVTLRLWLDPAGPSAERACCSPVVRGRRR